MPRIFSVSRREAARVSRLLRAEFASGLAVILAAIIGFAFANSGLAEVYTSLREFRFGPEAWGLNLSLGAWTADCLLAVFFFVVGLELKREFAFGALSKPATAIVPVVAAFGGVIVPALIFFSFNAGTEAARGWAIPTATDIAFAVAVLGLVAPRISPVLRVFLLTLAVVDDLIAITIIAIFFSGDLNWLPLAGSLAVIICFGAIARLLAPWFARVRIAAWVVLLPIGAVAWALMHTSGVHATIAGVLLAFAIPTQARIPRRNSSAHLVDPHSAAPAGSNDEVTIDLAGVFASRFSPLSNWIAVPLFAFFAAGVSVAGEHRFPLDPIAIGVLVGLVVGKPLGVMLSTWAITRFTRAELGDAVRFREFVGVACLAGVGFTVSLLITELSFVHPADADTARMAVLVGSIVSSVFAAILLARRRSNRS